MKLLIVSAFALCLSLEAFALPTPNKAPVEKPTIKTEDLVILQNRPAVKRYNVQTQGWTLKVEETKPTTQKEAKTNEGEKAL